MLREKALIIRHERPKDTEVLVNSLAHLNTATPFVIYNETMEPVYKSVRECRYRSIRKLEPRHVNLKPLSLRSVGFKLTRRGSNFRIDLTSIL